jgi:hypothetical protein
LGPVLALLAGLCLPRPAGASPEGRAQAARAAGAAAARAALPARKLPVIGALPLPRAVGRERLQALLQSFVDKAYGKAFRHLGEERDFDHGHFLFASQDPDAAPVAILYHTQELAYYAKPGSGYGWLDPEGRNWVQWLSDGRVENAKDLARADQPSGLPVSPEELKSHHTILAEMLQPARFGAAAGLRALRSRQVVFTKTACSAAAGQLTIRLPDASRVCLALSEY